MKVHISVVIPAHNEEKGGADVFLDTHTYPPSVF